MCRTWGKLEERLGGKLGGRRGEDWMRDVGKIGETWGEKLEKTWGSLEKRRGEDWRERGGEYWRKVFEKRLAIVFY